MSRRDRYKKRKQFHKVDSISDFIVEDDEESYDPNSSKGEYFDVDSLPLQKELISALSDSLNVSHHEISSVVSSVFNKVAPYMLDDYFDKTPSNQSWKLGQDSKTINRIEPQLLEIRNEMKEETPTISKILTATITKDDKKRCLRFLDQMNNVDKFSADYFRLQDSINEILGKSFYHTKEEVKFLESEELKLKSLHVNLDSLKTKILKLEADPEIKAKLLLQYEQMLSYPSDSPYYTTLQEEIEWSVKLPYQKREIDSYVTMDNIQLNRFYCNIRNKLDSELYGMEKVKNRILHVLNDRRSSGDECGRNIALVGPKGVGKTQICKVLAKVLDKKFAKISAGALDSSAIKGSNKVWTGSEPSIILQILATLKTNNVIIMFDEIDKLGETPQGKLAQHALLHVSDPSDNKDFQDNYLKNFSHDLSKILFIYCMNSTDCLDEALKDRFDIIEVEEYTNDEKLQIFKNYMLPKALTNVGMDKKDVIVLDSAIQKLLQERDIGLRSVEKIIKDIIGKVNMYKNILLPNGSLGNLNLNYTIPNFKIPLKIDYNLLMKLIQ